MMDSEKLIEQLRSYTYWLGQDGPESHDIHPLICDDAATALSILQDENSQLRESRDHWKRLAHELSEGVNGKDAEHERLQAENAQLRAELEYEREHANAYYEECGQWEAENEKLRAELEYEKEHANAYYEECGQWEAENTQLKEKLEALKQDRDAIEQDFRAFAKQWWEEDSGFPCRWCKFERQGGCEWKVKHPGEICAGRAFEWRGQQKED